MPTYEYQCVSCGHRFEKFQSFSAEPIKECPVCGEPVKKVIAPAGIIFKGSGWYITDSKKANTAAPTGSSEKKEKTDSDSATEKAASGDKAKPAETAAPAANGTGASTEKKTDSKPSDNKSSAA